MTDISLHVVFLHSLIFTEVIHAFLLKYVDFIKESGVVMHL